MTICKDNNKIRIVKIFSDGPFEDKSKSFVKKEEWFESGVGVRG